MSHQDLLNYTQAVKELKKYSLSAGISEDEFRKLYFESLKTHQMILNNHDRSNQPRSYRKYSFLIVITIVALWTAYNHRCIYNYLICNIQEYIYPGLRLIRKISIPFLSLFPTLTELYQEPCLIQNPFFTVADMDCWPCSTINNVRQINDPQPDQQHNGPFIYETDQVVLRMDTLKYIYIQNKQIFDKDAQHIMTNNKFYIKPQDLFLKSHLEIDEKNLYIWKITNFNLARIIRQIIPRPKVVPRFGQSTERFIIIDSSQRKFQVPDTECNYSFLLSLSGTRMVNLQPAEECKHQCKLLQVELKESYLLWYNWWYWRPVIQTSNGNSTFIAHVGSYC